jgi:hypothetical protein
VYFYRVKLSSLEAALQKRPFRAFEIRVDGESIIVRHPEQVLLAEDKTTAIIDVTDRIHILDVDQISKVALLRRGGTTAKA